MLTLNIAVIRIDGIVQSQIVALLKSLAKDCISINSKDCYSISMGRNFFEKINGNKTVD